jgi:NAD(P)-dependent dehydrogenase (short-subunit alcohol dehydrogenase family)
MVKKNLILFFGSSGGIGQELEKLLKKKYKIISFYNKKKILKKNNTISKKINFLQDKDINKITKIINLNKYKVVILNFASIKIDKLSFYIKETDYKKTMEINVNAFLKIINKVIPFMMKNNWGRIINVSSTGGILGDKGAILYSMSKNATLSMMKVMSKEYGKFNITFNTLKLGNFNYGLFKKLNKEFRKKLLEKVPSKKTGNIKNILFAIDFLIKTDYVNGSSINIDGGLDS